MKTVGVPKTRNKPIEFVESSLIFRFNQNRLGYDIDDYYPTITQHNFRIRDLIFFFHKLHIQIDGFQQLSAVKERAWLRKKAIVAYVFFLIFFLPALFSLQLLTLGSLKDSATIIILMIFVASIFLTVEFLVIDANGTKMEKRLIGVKLGRVIKEYLIGENYYWLFKKFVIFDVDSSLNIHMIFMKDAFVAKQFGITQQRLNAILNENKPIEKYKINQAIELREEENQDVQQEEDPMLQFKYDLSKLSQFNKRD